MTNLTVQGLKDVLDTIKNPKTTQIDFVDIGVNEQIEDVKVNVRHGKATIYGVFRSALDNEEKS